MNKNKKEKRLKVPACKHCNKSFLHCKCKQNELKKGNEKAEVN